MCDVIDVLEALATDVAFQQTGDLTSTQHTIIDEQTITMLKTGDVKALEALLGVRSGIVCAIFAPEKEPDSEPAEQPDDEPEQEPGKETHISYSYVA